MTGLTASSTIVPVAGVVLVRAGMGRRVRVEAVAALGAAVRIVPPPLVEHAPVLGGRVVMVIAAEQGRLVPPDHAVIFAETTAAATSAGAMTALRDPRRCQRSTSP